MNTEADAALADVGVTTTVTGRIDVAVSSRLATAGYTAPLDAAGTRTAVGLASANLDTQLDALPTNAELATALGNADDAVLAQVALVKAKTDALPSDPADASDIAAAFASVASTLSTIAGYLDTEITAIKAKTDGLPSDPADQSAVEAAITAAQSALAAAIAALSIPTAVNNADALLGRNIAGGANGGRDVTSALRAIRNKVNVTASAITVYQENDSTEAWTGVVTRTEGLDPLQTVDPT